MLEYGLVTLPRDIGRPLLIGVVIAGAITALIPPGSLSSFLGKGAWSVLLLMAAGIPIYVCATASVPLVAGLIYLGASPGAALAFLIAGPVSNAASFTTVWKILGRRSALIYLFTVAAAAFGGGVLLNWIAPGAGSGIIESGPAHGVIPIFYHLSAVILLAVIFYSFYTEYSEKKDLPAGSVESECAAGPGERIAFAVTGMTCRHCVETVRKALESAPGVERAHVDLKTDRATVTGAALDRDRLRELIEEAGYHVSSADAADESSKRT